TRLLETHMKNAQRLLDPNSGPPGGFRYFDSDTGYTVKSTNLRQLFKDAEKHRIANGLPIPENFELLIETWLCRQLPPGICVYRDGRGMGGSLCVHRGDVVRFLKCEACGGSIKAKINACAIHGECTVFNKEIGINSCLTCPDRLEPEEGCRTERCQTVQDSNLRLRVSSSPSLPVSHQYRLLAIPRRTSGCLIGGLHFKGFCQRLWLTSA